MQFDVRLLYVFCITSSVLSVGCSNGPTAIPALKVDSKKTCTRALELHDADQDGSLSNDELKTSPGLNYVVARADTDSDGTLSNDELVALFDGWNAKSIGLLTLRCNVTKNRRPVAGATVRLVPEEFLDRQVETAVGLTDEFGDAFLSVPKDKRPIADSPPGVQIGLYRVVISKKKGDKESIASKYNVETVLGQEVSFDDPGVMNGVKYEL